MSVFWYLNLNSTKFKMPWKRGLMMDDPYYLPPPPVFKLITVDGNNMAVDDLTWNATNEEEIQSIYNALYIRDDVDLNINKLKTLCELNNHNACLGYGRIFEFGAYNQTQNHTIAREYYAKAVKYGSKTASSLLSFYHRYYDKDIPLSIVEADISPSAIESVLSRGNQHIEGKHRPFSCPSAYNVIKTTAETVTGMFAFPIQRTLPNSTELARLTKSTDPLDMYNLAMTKIFTPYPSKHELKNVVRLLKNSFNAGYIQAGGPLAYILAFANVTNEVSQISDYHQQALKIEEPTALYLKYLLLNGKNYNGQYCDEILRLLRISANQNYSPSIEILGGMFYYGFCGVGRSNTKGYEYRSHGASLGNFKAIYLAAEQLIGGDGVRYNCERGVEMTRQLIEFGPWTKFFDKYVSKGSEHAFLKMIDLGLTPMGAIKSNKTQSNTYENNYLYHVRNARTGNDTSALWLALHTQLHEADEYFYRMTQLQTGTQVLVGPVKFYVMMRELPKYMAGKLSEDDAKLLVEYLRPMIINAIELVLFVSLMIMISVRVKILTQ